MTHDNFQPPEYDEPEGDGDDQISGAIRSLATLDLEEGAGQEAAFAILDRLMTHAYAEGRKDEAESKP